LKNLGVFAVINFRENRAEFEIFKALFQVTDLKVQQSFRKSLLMILTSFGQDRIRGLDNTMIEIAASGKNRYQINRALRTLTNEAGYKDNPFLLIALARTTVYKTTAPAFGSPQTNYLLVSKAVNAANKSLYDSASKSQLRKISRTEAGAINRWASEMYRESNLENNSIRRLWISRFLSMTVEERDSFEEGDIIQIVNTNVNEQSISEKELYDLDRIRAQERAGIPSSNRTRIPKTGQHSEKYFQKPSDRLQMKNALVRQKKRQQHKGYRPKYRTVDVSKPIYGSANRIAKGQSAVLHIVNEFLAYKNLYQESKRIEAENIREHEYLHKRAILQGRVNQERRRQIPYKPKKIKNWIVRLKRHANNLSSRNEKRKIYDLLGIAEIMLEESYAFWGRK